MLGEQSEAEDEEEEGALVVIVFFVSFLALTTFCCVCVPSVLLKFLVLSTWGDRFVCLPLLRAVRAEVQRISEQPCFCVNV